MRKLVGGKCDANALKMTCAAQQVTIKWIAALGRFICQLRLTVLYQQHS